MQRRDFLRTAALATAGAAVMGTAAACGKKDDNTPKPYKVGGVARMKLSWERYELKLAHVFTVASYSRTTTPDIQVKIEYDGYTGYGEASMPPYLGHTYESVEAFLAKRPAHWQGR